MDGEKIVPIAKYQSTPSFIGGAQIGGGGGGESVDARIGKLETTVGLFKWAIGGAFGAIVLIMVAICYGYTNLNLIISNNFSGTNTILNSRFDNIDSKITSINDKINNSDIQTQRQFSDLEIKISERKK